MPLLTQLKFLETQNKNSSCEHPTEPILTQLRFLEAKNQMSKLQLREKYNTARCPQQSLS